MRRRRADDLFDRFATFEALCAAALRAAAAKRRVPGPAAFLANLETEVLGLERELQSGAWRPSGYVSFEVHAPKRRLISAAPFRDRVVHQALHAVVAPLFERGFIEHSYANRVAVLKSDPRRLAAWRSRAEAFLGRRRLSLHPRKTHVAPTAAPATFLGFELRPGGRRRLPEENVRRFRNRLRGLRDRWRAGSVLREEVEQRVTAWVAHAAHADTWRLRRAIFRGGWFAPRGRPVPGA